MVGRVSLGRRDHARPNQFGAAFKLYEDGAGGDFVPTVRGDLDDLAVAVPVAGHVQSRLTANPELAVLAVHDLRRPELPVP